MIWFVEWRVWHLRMRKYQLFCAAVVNQSDVDYVGYTCRHLYQLIEEHNGSVSGKHVRDQHGRDPSDIFLRFKILRNCPSKFDWLIYEMFFYKRTRANLEHAVWLHPRKVIFIARSILYILLKRFLFYRSFARQKQWKCFAKERTFVPIGKRIYCSCHATWLPCKTSIVI